MVVALEDGVRVVCPVCCTASCLAVRRHVLWLISKDAWPILGVHHMSTVAAVILTITIIILQDCQAHEVCVFALMLCVCVDVAAPMCRCDSTSRNQCVGRTGADVGCICWDPAIFAALLAS